MVAIAPIRPSTTAADAALISRRLGRALGYRVEIDGETGVVVGVPLAGRPPRPLVLVVRLGDCVRFVSVRRVTEILSDKRQVLLRPAEDQS
jgi:hypothetical protein